jgi:hypothetical protein
LFSWRYTELAYGRIHRYKNEGINKLKKKSKFYNKVTDFSPARQVSEIIFNKIARSTENVSIAKAPQTTHMDALIKQSIPGSLDFKVSFLNCFGKFLKCLVRLKTEK